MPFDARRRRFGPIAPPPLAAVHVPDGAAFMVPSRLGPEEADRRAREAAQEGLLRPVDSHRADLELAQLVWVPVWRVDGSAEGVHVGVRAVRDRRGTLRGMLPTGGVRHRDAVVLLLARKMLPFDPTPAITLPMESLASRLTHPITDGEVLAPDMTADEAEREALAQLRRAVTPSDALYRDVDARARSTVLCHYPVWLRRYEYEGDVVKGERFEGHVVLSAVDGRVLCERHPPALRALAGRVKSIFKRR